MPPPHPDHPDDPVRRRRRLRKLVVGALVGGATLVAGGTAAHAFEDSSGYATADSGGGYDSGGYSDSGGFDSGGYSDSGGYDSGGYDTGGYDSGGYSDSGGFDSGGYDSGYSDVGAVDTGYSDVGSYDTGYSDVGSYDTGYSDVGSYDTGYSDVGAVDTGYSDVGSYDTGYSDVGSYDSGYSDVGAVDTGDATSDDLGSFDTGVVDTGYAEPVDTTSYAEPVDTTSYAEPVDTTSYAEPVDTTSYAAPVATTETVEPTTTVTPVDEVTTEVGGEDGSATGETFAGTATDHVDPTEGLTDEASGTYTTTHQVGTETETVAPTTVDGWFSDPEAATSTSTTFEGTETVQETGIPSIGTDGNVAGSIEESVDHLTVSETTTTVAPTDGEGWTTTQVDRQEYGPGWGVDLDPTDGTLEGSVTYQGEVTSSYDAGQNFGLTAVETGYDLTAGADATAEATLDVDSVGIDVGLEGTASAAGHVGVTLGDDTFAETELTATGTVEGEVQAGVEADLGLTEGSADVGLFGGLSASVEGEAEIAGITGTVGVTGSVGAGVGAGFDYSAENGVYSVSGHVHGAAVLGGGISGSITVDTNELAESATQAANAIGTAATEAWDATSQAVSDGWNATTTAVSDGWSSLTSSVSGFLGGRE